MTDVTNSDAARLVHTAAQIIHGAASRDENSWDATYRDARQTVAATLETLYGAGLWRDRPDRPGGQTPDDKHILTRRDVLTLLADVERLGGGE